MGGGETEKRLLEVNASWEAERGFSSILPGAEEAYFLHFKVHADSDSRPGVGPKILHFS